MQIDTNINGTDEELVDKGIITNKEAKAAFKCIYCYFEQKMKQ
jgi:hypothetical protein